jgi:hypothetical protein
MDELLHRWLKDAVGRRLALETGEALGAPSPSAAHEEHEGE